MPAMAINHVSLSATDLETSVKFFEDVFGMERIPTPNFGFPVQWLKVGELQLHIFEQPGESPVYHHIGLTVDDFETVYRRATSLGIQDSETFGYHLCELPNGMVQLYVRDPAGNLLEVNWECVSTLPEDVTADIVKLAERYPQNEENMRSTLFLKTSS